MKKRKKVISIILFVALCGIWSVFLWFGSILTYTFAEDILFPKSTLDIYAERWDITFPKDARIEYRHSERDNFFGEGPCYTIIKFDNRPDEFLETFTNEDSRWCINNYEKIAYSFQEEFDESKLVYPDDNFIFKALGYHNYHDILIMAYDESTNTLYYMEMLR